MKNWKTSVGTAAQQSSKSPLLFHQAALAAILLLAAVFFQSCNTDNNGFGDFKTNSEAAQRIRNGKVEIETVVIDSCEYLFTSTLPWSSDFSLTHKGNCKFCAARHSR